LQYGNDGEDECLPDANNFRQSWEQPQIRLGGRKGLEPRYAIMMRRFGKQPRSVEKPRPKPQHSDGLLRIIVVTNAAKSHWFGFSLATTLGYPL